MKHLLLTKTDVPKTSRKSILLGKKNSKKYPSLEEQKGTMYIRGNSCFLSTKSCLRFFLISFAREIKGFDQSFLGNEVDFRDIINVSQNILAKN